MKTINKELIEKINKLKELNGYISVVVDYKKEEEYSNLFNEVNSDIEKVDNELFGKDIEAIKNIVDIEESEMYYLYDKDEVIEELFPTCSRTTKNDIIQSAYNWIPEKEKIQWLLLNVLTDRKYYNVVNNVNDNYIISTKRINSI